MHPCWLDLWQQYPLGWRILLPVVLWSYALTGVAFGAARRIKLLPAIRSRDVHTVKKPRVGGIAMWLAIFAAGTVFALLPKTSGLLDFSQTSIGGVDRALWGIGAGMLVLLAFGVWDDLRNLGPGPLLLSQFLAALTLPLAGVGAPYLRFPNGSLLHLDQYSFTLPTWLGGAEVWLLSALFTVLWVVAVINVLNWFDGLDGLAGSITLTAALVLFALSVRVNSVATATLALIIAGATLGYLPWNWYPSRLFMGTVGSQLLGYLLAVTAIISGGKVATAVLVLGIPIFDAAVVILRRLSVGQSPFHADQRHLHHRLLRLGLTPPLVVLTMNLVAVIFGVLAVRAQEATEKGALTLFLLLCLLAVITTVHYLERRLRTAGHSERIA